MNESPRYIPALSGPVSPLGGLVCMSLLLTSACHAGEIPEATSSADGACTERLFDGDAVIWSEVTLSPLPARQIAVFSDGCAQLAHGSFSGYWLSHVQDVTLSTEDAAKLITQARQLAGSIRDDAAAATTATESTTSLSVYSGDDKILTTDRLPATGSAAQFRSALQDSGFRLNPADDLAPPGKSLFLRCLPVPERRASRIRESSTQIRTQADAASLVGAHALDQCRSRPGAFIGLAQEGFSATDRQVLFDDTDGLYQLGIYSTVE